MVVCLKLNILQKTFETLIKTIYMFSCIAKHPHLTYLAIFFRTSCWMYSYSSRCQQCSLKKNITLGKCLF